MCVCVSESACVIAFVHSDSTALKMGHGHSVEPQEIGTLIHKYIQRFPVETHSSFTSRQYLHQIHAIINSFDEFMPVDVVLIIIEYYAHDNNKWHEWVLLY